MARRMNMSTVRSTRIKVQEERVLVAASRRRRRRLLLWFSRLFSFRRPPLARSRESRRCWKRLLLLVFVQACLGLSSAFPLNELGG